MINDEPTKYLRQMFHRPNTAPFAAVLMLILLMFFICPCSGLSRLPRIILPDAVFDECMPYDLPYLIIDKSGGVYFDGRRNIDLEKLACLIEDYMEKRTPNGKCMFGLRIDSRTPFGAVIVVMQAVREAGIRNLVFITPYGSNVLTYMRDERLKEVVLSKALESNHE